MSTTTEPSASLELLPLKSTGAFGAPDIAGAPVIAAVGNVFAAVLGTILYISPSRSQMYISPKISSPKDVIELMLCPPPGASSVWRSVAVRSVPA